MYFLVSTHAMKEPLAKNDVDGVSLWELRDFVLRRSFSPINIVNEKAYNTSKKVQRKTDAGLRGLPRPWWD